MNVSGRLCSAKNSFSILMKYKIQCFFFSTTDLFFSLSSKRVSSINTACGSIFPNIPFDDTLDDPFLFQPVGFFFSFARKKLKTHNACATTVFVLKKYIRLSIGSIESVAYHQSNSAKESRKVSSDIRAVTRCICICTYTYVRLYVYIRYI